MGRTAIRNQCPCCHQPGNDVPIICHMQIVALCSQGIPYVMVFSRVRSDNHVSAAQRLTEQGKHLLKVIKKSEFMPTQTDHEWIRGVDAIFGDCPFKFTEFRMKMVH